MAGSFRREVVNLAQLDESERRALGDDLHRVQDEVFAGVDRERFQWAVIDTGDTELSREERDDWFERGRPWRPEDQGEGWASAARRSAASWSKKTDVSKLKVTGADRQARSASVWLDDKQRAKMGLGSGHWVELRAVDMDGNASESVRVQIDGTSWASGSVREVVNRKPVETAGGHRSLLDGDSRKQFLLKGVAATTPPRFDPSFVRFETDDNGNARLVTTKPTEPGVRVQVRNLRTNELVMLYPDPTDPLSIDAANGDTLTMTAFDSNDVATDEFELRYSSKCKDGKASTLGLLSVRLKPVIK